MLKIQPITIPTDAVYHGKQNAIIHLPISAGSGDGLILKPHCKCHQKQVSINEKIMGSIEPMGWCCYRRDSKKIGRVKCTFFPLISLASLKGHGTCGQNSHLRWGRRLHEKLNPLDLNLLGPRRNFSLWGVRVAQVDSTAPLVKCAI